MGIAADCKKQLTLSFSSRFKAKEVLSDMKVLTQPENLHSLFSCEKSVFRATCSYNAILTAKNVSYMFLLVDTEIMQEAEFQIRLCPL